MVDTRLSNSASVADYWLPTQPGSEAALLLTFCRELLVQRTFNESFVRQWVNWETYLQELHPDKPCDFEVFIASLIEDYSQFTPEFAAAECGVSVEMVREVAAEIGRAGSRLAS